MKVDLSAQYATEIGGLDTLFSLDIFNVFNSQNATVINEYGDLANGGPNPDYNKIQQFQRPRFLRLSARVRFN